MSPTEEYDYVKHLRVQLSTNEQIFVFLNSSSQVIKSCRAVEPNYYRLFQYRNECRFTGRFCYH
ncbi:hypothetical protein HQN84_09265 [Pedobacter steynii]|nr:hypothetical protein [Pedobacter steynii]